MQIVLVIQKLFLIKTSAVGEITAAYQDRWIFKDLSPLAKRPAGITWNFK